MKRHPATLFASVALFAAALAGCAHVAQSPVALGPAALRQDAEKADTDALLAYAATAASVNAYEATPGADRVKAEALRASGWRLLGKAHAVYRSGAVADIADLLNLAQSAATLGK